MGKRGDKKRAKQRDKRLGESQRRRPAGLLPNREPKRKPELAALRQGAAAGLKPKWRGPLDPSDQEDPGGEYQNTRTYDYVARVIRDGLIVNAHRGGISQKEISTLVGDIGQRNVARAPRRAFTRRDVVPGGMLAADEAQERSGLGPAAFMGAVRAGGIEPKPTGSPGVRAFNPEDVAPSRFSRR